MHRSIDTRTWYLQGKGSPELAWLSCTGALMLKTPGVNCAVHNTIGSITQRSAHEQYSRM